MRGRLPRREALIGTVLPDFLDKPLYYGLALATGRRGAELGIVRGTRTFGHTLALAGAVWLVGRARGSDRLRALALGMATHPILDFVADYGSVGWDGAVRGCAALWPLTGWRFPLAAHANLAEHVGAHMHPFLLAAELVGVLLLLRAWARDRAVLRT